MNPAHGKPAFVISLDFELVWGVRDHPSLEAYKRNLMGAREAVPALLQVFSEYGIHATWATVGLLFCNGREEAIAASPTVLPQYRDRGLFPYDDLPGLGDNEAEDPLHFAPSLVRMIQATPHQEIGTHTLSHFYCLEEKQSVDAFRADLGAARKLAAKFGLELRSLVFPRNQYAPVYLRAAADAGILAFRGTQNFWIHRSRRRQDESAVRRGLRLLDAYIPITSGNGAGHSNHDSGLINVPASAFLRPYAPARRPLEKLRLRRITNAMDSAAQTGETFHLWWHPHNFGVHLDENMDFLRAILRHQLALREQYGMESLTMAEAAARDMVPEREVAV
jgi:hypothetical protein